MKCEGGQVNVTKLFYAIEVKLLTSLQEPLGNHKAKTCNRYTNDKEKKIKAYHYKKIIS